ncbi:MAG TPA: hypothetical protein ENI68_06355 [Gammaproteobacteria bacterium]|nr:hypothetical protein [Gammaproteobacteria bacterium]
MMYEHGYRNCLPKHFAELGPGNSLGVGLAALLTGSEKYLAFDIMEHADIATNLKVFDGLVELFENEKDIPDGKEIPDDQPTLRCYAFPHDILSEERLDRVLAKWRIEQIRYSIERQNAHGSMIHPTFRGSRSALFPILRWSFCEPKVILRNG